AWQTLPSPGTSVDSVARNADGRLELFGKNNKAVVVHAWQLKPAGSWSGWAPLGTAVMYGYVTAAKNSDGRLEIFAQGSDSVGTHGSRRRVDGRAGRASAIRLPQRPDVSGPEPRWSTTPMVT